MSFREKHDLQTGLRSPVRMSFGAFSGGTVSAHGAEGPESVLSVNGGSDSLGGGNCRIICEKYGKCTKLIKSKKIEKSTCFFSKSVVGYRSTADAGQNTKAIWLIGQAVKTPPSHGGNRGSIPLSAVKRTLRFRFGDFKVFLFQIMVYIVSRQILYHGWGYGI